MPTRDPLVSIAQLRAYRFSATQEEMDTASTRRGCTTTNKQTKKKNREKTHLAREERKTHYTITLSVTHHTLCVLVPLCKELYGLGWDGMGWKTAQQGYLFYLARRKKDVAWGYFFL